MAEIRLLRNEIQLLKEIVSTLTPVPGTIAVQIGGETIQYKYNPDST